MPTDLMPPEQDHIPETVHPRPRKSRLKRIRRRQRRNRLIVTLAAVICGALLLCCISAIVISLPDQPHRPFIAGTFHNMAGANNRLADRATKQIFNEVGFTVSDTEIMLYEATSDGIFRYWCPARQHGNWCIEPDTDYFMVIPLKSALGKPDAGRLCMVTIIYDHQVAPGSSGMLSILGADVEGGTTTIGYIPYCPATSAGLRLQHSPLFDADDTSHAAAFDHRGNLFLSFHSGTPTDDSFGHSVSCFIDTEFGYYQIAVMDAEAAQYLDDPVLDREFNVF